MNYGPGWTAPWRESEQASCSSSDCTLRGARLCIKATMTRGPSGLVCVQCAKRLGLAGGNDKGPEAPEQLVLDNLGVTGRCEAPRAPRQ